jgi:putative ABC transport system permease protein
VMPGPPWLDVPWREAKHFNAMSAIQRIDDAAVAGFEQRATLAIRREDQANNQGMVVDTLQQVLTGPIVGVRGPGTPGQELVIATRLGAVALVVLVIACANVVNVLLARAVRRRREVAVRLTLGVTRARLVRLLATEAVFLAALSAIVALLASWWAGEALRTMLLGDIAWRDRAIDGRVVLFTIALTLVAALASGLVPALQGSRPQLTEALKQGVREGGARHGRLRAGLVVAQSALSVMLLVGAALFVRSLNNVKGLDIGFDPERLLFGEVEFDEGRAPAQAALDATLADVAERLRTHPAVEEVARAGMQPMRGWSIMSLWIGNDTVAGMPPTMSVVTPGFFRATGLAVIEGRAFGAGAATGEGEVVVNRAMADRFWPGRTALGQCLHIGKRDTPCQTVVGVVETATRDEVTEKEPAPQYYVPLGSSAAPGWSARTLVVRTRAGERSGEAASAALLQALRQALPTGFAKVTPMTENLEPQYRPWRLGAGLFTAFGLLALVIAMIGMYGTVSYGVTQRTHEFGVRTALGARVRDIVTLVLRQALATAVLGVVLGVALALAAGRLVASLVFGVSPRDPVVMGTVALLLVAMAAIAALLPAWRGAKVDPARVLRSE